MPKKPFSAKAKKEQLKAKRVSKSAKTDGDGESSHKTSNNAHENDDPTAKPELKSVFATETKQVAQKRTEQSWKPYSTLSPEKAFECDLEDYYGKDAIIDVPKRPPWTYGMSKATLEANEKTMFKEWIDSVYAKYPAEQLSYFEHNLEVWRQLWRVIEISDILLIIVDVRHPLVHFPPALYHWVHDQLKRPVVLVLNKIDLVSRDVVAAWVRYFNKRFPDLHIATFSCYPAESFVFNDQNQSDASMAKRSQIRRRRYHRSVGVRDILSACKDVSLIKRGLPVDWQAIIQRYATEQQAIDEEGDEENDSDEDDVDQEEPPQVAQSSEDEDFTMSEGIHSEYVTIGLVGHPNVGKSSIINGILGKTVVSASRTPGHTKHFQTIHLTENVRLSDCPGLVFPSLLPKPVQVLCGMFNIAQVREPFSVVQYLAERVPLPELLDIFHPSLLDEDDIQPNSNKPIKMSNKLRSSQAHPPWTAWAICEGFAIKKGFYTAKAGRPDTYRAANLILRLAFDGRILLSMKPRGFYAEKANETAINQELSSRYVYSTNNSSSFVPKADGEEEEDDDEDEDADQRKQGTSASFNPFALLENDDDDGDEEDEDDDDEEE